MSTSGDRIAVGSNDGYVIVFNAKNGQIIRKHKFRGTVPVTAVSFTRDETSVCATCTSSEYNFVSTAPSCGQKCTGIFAICLWMLVISIIIRYVLISFHII